MDINFVVTVFDPNTHATADDGTPESATLSIVDEAEDFPSIPHDLDFYAHEPTAFELSQVYEYIFPSLSYFILAINEMLF